MRSCFFIGHKEASDEVYPALADAVEQHVTECGVTAFFVGHYGGFDRMAAKAVIAAKKRHPGITLSLLIPYHPAERPIEPPAGFDCTFYPPDMESVPCKLAIVRANRYMVDHVDDLIAYVWHSASNAWNLVEYARKREKLGCISVTVLEKG